MPYHLSLLTARPDLVESFEVFDGNNTFRPIKLRGKIADYDLEIDDVLSAAFWYNTPFPHNTLALTLGADGSIN